MEIPQRTMTLQIRAIPRREERREAIHRIRYHDITNPGNPQTGYPFFPQFFDRTMTLQIRAIPILPSMQKQSGTWVYHDITNPGNPQT